MQVTMWQFSVAPAVWIDNEKDIIDAIKLAGKAVTTFPTTKVDGHLYILGGRESIINALNFPNGEFFCSKGHLRAEMMRFSHSVFSKTYTLIHIDNSPNGTGGLKIRGWSPLTTRGVYDPGLGAASVIKFTELITQIRTVDARAVG